MPERIIKVVLTTPLDEQNIQKIKAVSKGISVDQVSGLIVAERKGNNSDKAKLDLLLREAEVLYGYIHHFPRDLPKRLSRLKWIQSMTAG
ncbi:MAG TPA: hypothetical protein DCZ97_00185, partial [Syntrophus sp. (in: bacteria)]|nr:hypothetical protein [Syntrophus sp. (in: bacteria)]